MYLTQLDINQVRNLHDVKIKPGKRCNYIFGNNASGKTSVLEAIYLLSVARSFRTTHIKHVISYNSPLLQIFARIQSDSNQEHTALGLERSDKKTRIRINGSDVKQVSELSSLLPVQIINPDVHKLLEQGPKYRRQFIDWGVFHVEHGFLQAWQQYYRVLKQRNAALRKRLNKKDIILWDDQLIQYAKSITLARESYLSGFLPIFNRYINTLMGLSVEISYVRGWNTELSFTETLSKSFEKDIFKRFTSSGPHRADLAILHNGIPVQNSFSRGQQKLLVCAMRLAQINHLKKVTNQQSVLLVDDLAAELDVQHRQNLIDLLVDTQAQLFLTATEQNSFILPPEIESKMFHVEHGIVKEVVQ
ncbi:MAG: DNA replication/repair protein RecF [Gammaproteobacteria bacterium]|nr:DNA replication/repair protein RecF [Gammaproteobacteria bacterium]